LRRVVVTGLGVVSGLGSDLDTFWRRCLAGEAVVTPIPDLWARCEPRSRHYAPLGPLPDDPALAPRLERKRLDPVAWIALHAAASALHAAGFELEAGEPRGGPRRLRGVDRERAASFVGTGVGGLSSCLANGAVMLFEAPRAALRAAAAAGTDPTLAAQVAAIAESVPMPAAFSPFTVAQVMPSAPAAAVSIKFGLHGPSRAATAACASGTVAIGDALRAVRAGECDIALAGGCEYLHDDHGSAFRAFDAAGALAHGPDPARLNRPFDAQRSGFLFADGGAAMLVLEAEDHARARGARVLAEIRGYGETSDAHSMMAVAPDPRQARRAIEACLHDAGLAPGDVDYVNAHGTGTLANDEAEAELLRALFGARPWVNATKGLLGHTLGASGALEAAVAVLSLRDGTTHPCAGLEQPIGGLRYVREERPAELRAAVSPSFAFGGHNAVLAFAAPRG
jgi:3-oxoacyl-[acyl-carrier-protein] synthase II